MAAGRLVGRRRNVKLRKSRSVKSVRLYLKGIEQTSWLDGKKKKSNEAQWFDSALILWGFPSGISYKEMSAGRYVWPFRIAIPNVEQLPPTFAHSNDSDGFVRYSLYAHVVDENIELNVEETKILQVQPRVPLDAHPEFFSPVELEGHREVRTWYFGINGSIDMFATCNTRSFVAGDTVPISVRLVNNSGVNVSAVCAKLEECLELYLYRLSKESHFKVVAKSKVKQLIRAHSGVNNVQVNLSVPNAHSRVGPSFNSAYINRAYRISVVAQVDQLFTKDMGVTFEAFCGTARESICAPADSVPSLFNPNGAERTKRFLCKDNDAQHPVPICVDGFDYDFADQSDSENCVRYPTFYSADFSIPQTLMQFNQELYNFLSSVSNK